jgi:nucleoside 2-deoxyribosyltransferase
VTQINTAKVVIADITPENPNVFWEVGYAHANRKPTILVAEKGRKLPFDVSGFRILFYENTIAGKRLVEDGLRKHLKAILTELRIPTTGAPATVTTPPREAR